MSDISDETDTLVDEIVEGVMQEISGGGGVDELADAVADDVADQVTERVYARLSNELDQGASEPYSPAEAIDRFIKKRKKKEVDSIGRYKTKLEYIEEFLADELGLENLNDLTPDQAEDFRDWRQYESLDRDEPLADTTLKDDMYLFREFIEYMVKLRAVRRDVYDVIEIPSVDKKDAVDKGTLDPDRAAEILEYLERYHHASLQHVTQLLHSKTGRRPCDLHALDVSHFDDEKDDEEEDVTLEFEHQPESGTALKEDGEHEAVIKLSDETGQVIRDFIDDVRSDVVDEFGRSPLLATDQGRMAKSTIREYTYRWTRPCELGNGCPHDREIDNCEAKQNEKQASKCPSTRSPKEVRSGYITAKLNAGSSYEAVGHRVGATKDVLKRHYDHPDDDEERKRHQEDIMEKNEDTGGYANNPDDSTQE